MRPEGCARARRKYDAHAFQHRYRVCTAHELAIVHQSLASAGSALQLVGLARSTGASTSSGSSLEAHCLLLKNVSRHGRRLSNSGSCASPLTTTTSDATPDVVTDVEWTAEKFRRHVIPLCDQIVALLGE